MKKIWKIVLLVIVPLLVAAGISVYAYYRYQDTMYFYQSYYMEQAEYKNTEDTLEKYFMYNASYYDEYYRETVKVTDKKTGDEVDGFKFVVYRWFDVDTYEDEDGDEQTTKALKYIYLIYDVNYANIYYSIYNTDDKDNRFNDYLPIFKLEITDGEDEDITEEYTFSSNSAYAFRDYNFTGYEGSKKWYNGEKIETDNTKVYVQWVTVNAADVDFSQNVTFEVKAFDQLYTDEEDDCYFVALTHDVTDFHLKASKLDINDDTETATYYGKTLITAYDQDVQAAGYNKYVFTKWIWWEAILAIVLVEIVTISTVIVWENEAEKETKQNNKNAY